MRTLRVVQASYYSLLSVHLDKLLPEMAAQGYRVVGTEHAYETKDGAFLHVYFDNDPAASSETTEDFPVVLEGSNAHDLNFRLKAFLAGHEVNVAGAYLKRPAGKLLSVGQVSSVKQHGVDTLMVVLMFATTKPESNNG